MHKRNKFIIFILAAILIIVNILVVNAIINGKNKEVRATERFVDVLEDIHAIPMYKRDRFQSIEITSNRNINTPTRFTVMSEHFGVDLDSDYNVIGFSLNSGIVMPEERIVNEGEAIALAEEYLGNITKEQFKFKEVQKVHTDEESFTILFYKYYEGYPYYNLDIVVKINKMNGMLTGYTNPNPVNLSINKEKNITVEKAKEIAKEYCTKMKLIYSNFDSPNMYYIRETDNEAALAYEFKFDSAPKNNEDQVTQKTIFISAKDGKVILLKDASDAIKEKIKNE